MSDKIRYSFINTNLESGSGSFSVLIPSEKQSDFDSKFPDVFPDDIDGLKKNTKENMSKLGYCEFSNDVIGVIHTNSNVEKKSFSRLTYI